MKLSFRINFFLHANEDQALAFNIHQLKTNSNLMSNMHAQSARFFTPKKLNY